MVTDSEGTMVFEDGDREKSIPARIIVHDRNRVENEILPRFFNHSSFASLRRQLNYFAFSRVGKGKEKGAVYINEKVFKIDDILCLKRRLNALSEEPPVLHSDNEKKLESVPNGSKTVQRLASFPSSSKLGAKRSVKRKPTKKAKYNVYDMVSNQKLSTSEMTSPNGPCETTLPSENSTPSRSVRSPSEVSMDNSNGKVILDLTQPIEDERKTFNRMSNNRVPVAISRDTSFNIPHSLGQEDIMVGCSALLSLGWNS